MIGMHADSNAADLLSKFMTSSTPRAPCSSSKKIGMHRACSDGDVLSHFDGFLVPYPGGVLSKSKDESLFPARDGKIFQRAIKRGDSPPNDWP